MLRLRNGRFPGFKTPLSLEIGVDQKWAVLGPKRGETLNIVAGRDVADPPNALSYPAFGKDEWPSQAITLMRFGASPSSTKAPFLSARYESFRDETDLSLGQVLQQQDPQLTRSHELVSMLHLESFWDRWFATLSNGQNRRAQLALALLRQSRMLVLDEPFLGLDPPNRELFSKLLGSLPIPVVVGLRQLSEVPPWVTHLVVATEENGLETGPRAELAARAAHIEKQARDMQPLSRRKPRTLGPPVIELRGVTVAYRGNPILENLELVVRQGERLHIRGPNGSGKSTLLALLTADHPQSWNERVVLLGEPREVGKHSYFGIQDLIGHSSPEIHGLFSRSITVRNAIRTGFTGSLVAPKTSTPEQDQRVAKLCDQLGLKSTDLEAPFGQVDLATQKLALYARALVRDPPILILDEAFSTLAPDQLQRAFDVLDEYTGTVLLVGHVESEIPACDSEITLG